MKCFSVAIDGYVATGKGTLASLIAKKYNLLYLDTGSIYRAVTYAYIHFKDNDIDHILSTIDLNITNEDKVYLNGMDITSEIRKQDINENIIMISRNQKVRAFATRYAQNVAKGKSIVMDGRDIGSVVLPNADIKFLITASVEVRTKRRYSQNLQKGLKISEEQVRNDIILRDEHAKNDVIKVFEDTIIIDNTDLSLEESFNLMCSYIDRKLGYNG